MMDLGLSVQGFRSLGVRSLGGVAVESYGVQCRACRV